jgi:hypothetical protein
MLFVHNILLILIIILNCLPENIKAFSSVTKTANFQLPGHERSRHGVGYSVGKGYFAVPRNTWTPTSFLCLGLDHNGEFVINHIHNL